MATSQNANEIQRENIAPDGWIKNFQVKGYIFCKILNISNNFACIR